MFGDMKPRSSTVPKRAWAALALTLVSLPILAWLQVGWTDQASRAQASQMQQRLAAAGAQAGSTLEVERVVLREYVHNLRLPKRSDGAPPREAVAEALKFWRDRTRTPRILKGLWLVGPGQASFLDAGAGTWTEVAWDRVPEAVRTLAEALNQPEAEPDPSLFGRDFFPAEPVRFNPFLLMVPEADLEAVVSDLVPDVLAQAFGGPQGMADFSLTVRDSATGAVVYQHGPVPAPGAPADLVQTLWNGARTRTGDSVLSNPILRLWLHQGEVHDNSRWVLEVRHIDGSIAAVFDRIRWTNLALSLALLLLLAAGVLLLFGLYGRSRRMVRSQKSFVASVSHELRTPLAVLRAAAENMKEGLVRQPDQAIRYGTRMLEESDRLLQLTENVLSYAQIGSQRVSIGDQGDRWTRVDLGTLAAETAPGWSEAFARAGARLEVEVPADALLVRGDRGALKAVADNLLSNALRYGTPGGGMVQISVRRVEVRLPWTRKTVPRVRLEVRDEGPGIRARDRKRVFEPFYQTSDKHSGGIGLGLSLVDRIAAAHGGTARVAPTRGRGTTVQVDLPPEAAP